MFKGLTLRALVNERLNAAADDVFALFEKTIAEYEEELCRSKEENRRKQRLLDFLCPKIVPVCGEGQSSSTNPDPGLNQKQVTKTPQVKEDPEEQSVKQEEEQLPVSIPKSSPVFVKSEEPTLLQGQTEHQKETQEENITLKPHLHPETEGDTDNSSDTDNDDDWECPLSYSAAQMETETDGDKVQIRDRSSAAQNLQPLSKNKSAPETSSTVNNRDMPKCYKRGEGKHQCSVCRKTFKRKDHLQTHRLVHVEKKPYSCSLCDKTFKHSPHLKIHMRTHTGERPYSCSICDKTFRYTSTLKTHMRTHTGEKPYSCSFCNKTFAQIGHLQAHIRSHTGQAPYSCSLCHKTFVQNSNLKAHMMTHTAERPYICSLCDHVFSSVRALTKHMTTHTQHEQSPSAEVLGDKAETSQI